MIVCPYCETENEDDAEFCKICKQRIEEPIDFEAPVRELSEVTTKILKKEIPHTRDYMNEAYRKIMNSVQLILDQTMLKLQDNIEDLSKFRDEARESLAEEEFQQFQRFMDDFETAQEQINQGLRLARTSFFEAKSFRDLEKGQIDLSAATSAIAAGLSKLEDLTIETQEPDLLTTPLEFPPGVERAVEILDSVLVDVNDFIESGDPSYLRTTVENLDRSRFLIFRELELLEEDVESLRHPNLEKMEEEFSGLFVMEPEEELEEMEDVEDMEELEDLEMMEEYGEMEEVEEYGEEELPEKIEEHREMESGERYENYGVEEYEMQQKEIEEEAEEKF